MSTPSSPWIELLGLSLEVAVLIVVPLLVGLGIGKFLDTMFFTTPILLVIGIIGAMVVSGILLMRKIVKMLK